MQKKRLLESCSQRWGWGILGMLKQQLHGGQQEWDPSLSSLSLSLSFCWVAEGEDGRKLLCMVSLTSIPFSLCSLCPLISSPSSYRKQRCKVREGPVIGWWGSVYIGEGDAEVGRVSRWRSKLFITTLWVHFQGLSMDWMAEELDKVSQVMCNYLFSSISVTMQQWRVAAVGVVGVLRRSETRNSPTFQKQNLLYCKKKSLPLTVFSLKFDASKKKKKIKTRKRQKKQDVLPLLTQYGLV